MIRDHMGRIEWTPAICLTMAALVAASLALFWAVG